MVIDCNKSTTLVGNVDSGEGVCECVHTCVYAQHVCLRVGLEVHGKSL